MNSSGASVMVLWRVWPSEPRLGAEILPPEDDTAHIQGEQPTVGDGHPVRVARQLGPLVVWRCRLGQAAGLGDGLDDLDD